MLRKELSLNCLNRPANTNRSPTSMLKECDIMKSVQIEMAEGHKKIICRYNHYTKIL